MKNTTSIKEQNRIAPNVDSYIYGFDNNGPEAAGVYQCELNLLINTYTTMAEEEALFRPNKSKKSQSLIIIEERLAYWKEIKRNSEQEDWWQVEAEREFANKNALIAKKI